MAEQEGVIKYRLFHRDNDLPEVIDFATINAWRWLLFKLDLIGQHPGKYAGLGYGNLSQRVLPDQPTFVISGTQTGHFEHLGRHHFAMVDDADPQQNSLHSSGPIRPSSEALTHAGIYQCLPHVNAVIHVHCPVLWRHAATLGLPCTASEIAYGTVEMAIAVEHLLNDDQLTQTGLFCMLGHQDGVVSIGEDLATAVQRLLTQLTRAVAVEQATRPL